MTVVINREHDVHFNKKRIYRLMQILHLKSVTRVKKNTYIPSTPQFTAENILNRDFHADKPNEKWLTDVTEFNQRLCQIEFHFCRNTFLFVVSEKARAPLVVKEHRHDEHQNIFVLRLFCWYDDSGTAWVCQLDDDVVACEIAQNFHQTASLEADADRRAIVFARQLFLCRC